MPRSRKNTKKKSLALVLYDGSMRNHLSGWEPGKTITDNAPPAAPKMEKKEPEKYHRYIASDTF